MIELLLEAERAMAGGQLERARQLYEQVAEADPRNAIAVVGLARVAEARDDALGAYLLARRALAIDPEDDAARRLAAGLETALAGPAEPVVESPPGTETPPPGAATAVTSEAGTFPPAPSTPAGGSDLSRPRRHRSVIDRFLRRGP